MSDERSWSDCLFASGIRRSSSTNMKERESQGWAVRCAVIAGVRFRRPRSSERFNIVSVMDVSFEHFAHSIFGLQSHPHHHPP
jgi:hypothetical protein